MSLSILEQKQFKSAKTSEYFIPTSLDFVSVCSSVGQTRMLLLSWVIEYSWQENTIFGEWFLDPTVKELEMYFTKYDVKRLELYAQNMVDYHLIVDLLPSISRLYFLNQMDVQLSIVQSVSFIS